MIFYQDERGRRVWDPETRKVIAEFDERTRKYETDDPKVIDKMIKFGFEYDEIEDTKPRRKPRKQVVDEIPTTPKEETPNEND